MALIWYAGRDESAPDTTDLVPEQIVLSPEDNAFTHFAAATNHLFWPDDAAFRADFMASEPVDEPRLRDFVARNAMAVETLRKGLQCTACVPPTLPSFAAPFDYVEPWLRIAKFLALKARLERRRGDFAGATDTCIALLQFGNLQQQHTEGLIGYFVALACLRQGLVEALHLARDRATPADELERLEEVLARTAPTHVGLVRAVQVEYRSTADIVDRLSDGQLDPRALTRMPAPAPLTHPLAWRPPAYVFKPNATKRMMAEGCREAIRSAPRTYAAREITNVASRLHLEEGTPMTYIRSNAIGRTLARTSWPPYDSLLAKRCQADAHLAGARLVVACVRYERAHGQLPDDLSELVPALLPEVPIDPYDGKPFRYVRSNALVYAVGQDLVDSGGSRKPRHPDRKPPRNPNPWASEDFVIPITPVESAAQSHPDRDAVPASQPE